MPKRSIGVLLLIAAFSLLLFAGCGGSPDGGKTDTPVRQTAKFSGVVFLDKDGSLSLLRELSGGGSPIVLSDRGGRFDLAEPSFSNAPWDDAGQSFVPCAAFSRDGKYVYYFTDIDGQTGVLHCAEVKNLKPESDKNSDALQDVASDVLCHLIPQSNGFVYSKNGGARCFFLDGSQTAELCARRVQKAWPLNDGTGMVMLTEEDTLEYMKYGERQSSVLSEDVDTVWYGGGKTVYYLTGNGKTSTEAPADAPAASRDSDPSDYDRTAADESRSYYSEESSPIMAVTLDGRKTKAVESWFGVEKVVGDTLFYSRRYVDKLRLSNLVDVSQLDHEALYQLDHSYIEDCRFELWQYDGENAGMLCGDAYLNDRDFDGDSYYSDPGDHLEVFYSAALSDLLITYWDSLENLDRFTEEAFGASVETAQLTAAERQAFADELAQTLMFSGMRSREIFDVLKDADVLPHGEVREAFDQLLRNTDERDLLLRDGFAADADAAVYARALTNEVQLPDPSVYGHSADSLTAAYWMERCGKNPFVKQAFYTLSDGRTGVVPGVNAGSYLGSPDGHSLVFVEGDTITVYDAAQEKTVFSVENAAGATLAGNRLCYFRGGDLVAFDGTAENTLAESVYTEAKTAWVYADGYALALSNVSGGRGTLRVYDAGSSAGVWIADGVTYYQRISDREIIYISDGTLYVYEFGKDPVRLSGGVVEVCGAYYAGTLIGYRSAER